MSVFTHCYSLSEDVADVSLSAAHTEAKSSRQQCQQPIYSFSWSLWCSYHFRIQVFKPVNTKAYTAAFCPKSHILSAKGSYGDKTFKTCRKSSSFLQKIQSVVSEYSHSIISQRRTKCKTADSASGFVMSVPFTWLLSMWTKESECHNLILFFPPSLAV